MAGLTALESYSVVAVAIGHDSARIGDGQGTYDHGIVTGRPSHRPAPTPGGILG